MSRHANAGKLVITGTGKLGIIYNRDMPFNDPAGRVPVTLLDEKYQPLLKEGERQVLLCNPNNCRLTGYQD